MTSSLEVSLCFPLELEMKLAIGTAFFEDLLNLGNILPAAEHRTPDEMAPFEGAEGGAWLSQRVARWLKLQVNQLRHMTGWGKPENT
jgi:hypothetical protein